MSLKPRSVVFDEIWPGIQDTVNLVLNMGNVDKDSWNKRFSDIYALCIAVPEPLAPRLYQETKTLLESHVQHLCSVVKTQGDENLLAEYHKHWINFSKGTQYLNNLYWYLNTQHVRKSKITEADITYGSLSVDLSEYQQEIGELAFEIWEKYMIMPLRDSLVSILLTCIKDDRLYHTTASPTLIIWGVINSFVEVNMFKSKTTMHLYQTIFADQLITETGEFYRAEASTLLQTCSISHYMEKVIGRLKDEHLRSTKFLPPISHTQIQKEVQTRMIADHLTTLQNEAANMVSRESMQDLSNMFILLKTLPKGIVFLVKLMQDHIKQQGLQAVSCLKGENLPCLYVECLLEVHNKYKTMIQKIFQSDQQFVGALDKAFESILNQRVPPRNICRSPELLSKYCDGMLKKSSKGLSESEVDDKLAQCITIFKYIEDKDIFQKFYSRHLAKRLIHQQSQSMDSEEAMINRMKMACGYEYTSKLHRMYTDMTVTAGHNQKFQKYLVDNNIDLGINFSINVLQAGAWPLGQGTVTPFTVPLELEKAVQCFEVFYGKNFSGRKLTWLHAFCQGELKVGHTKRTYIITMPTYQMAMLLMFEKVNSVTCKELIDHTGLPHDQFSKFLQSLVDCKLLLCDSDAFQDIDTIHLNMDYTNKRTKFKITIANMKETQAEIERTHTAVEEDRRLYIQAAIVRIMKARKILRHSLLVQEVISQSKSRFASHVPMIKKCIEILIDKQYLERTPNTTDEYSYVA